MTWTACVQIVGQVLVVAGFILAASYRRSPSNTFVPSSFEALRLEARRRRLVQTGVVLSFLGLAAQLSGVNLTIWG